jgi:IPT/TIG domain
MKLTLKHAAIILVVLVLELGIFLGSFSAAQAADIEIDADSESTGPVGTSVTINGTGFAPSETGIDITFDGKVVISNRKASTSGAWHYTFDVPEAASGDHVIDAYGDVTDAGSVPDVFFTVTPAVSINPTSGGTGSSVTVTGNGFGESESGSFSTARRWVPKKRPAPWGDGPAPSMCLIYLSAPIPSAPAAMIPAKATWRVSILPSMPPPAFP